jgi:hypothetical protein
MASWLHASIKAEIGSLTINEELRGKIFVGGGVSHNVENRQLDI